jgi:hypothetical protein
VKLLCAMNDIFLPRLHVFAVFRWLHIFFLYVQFKAFSECVTEHLLVCRTHCLLENAKTHLCQIRYPHPKIDYSTKLLLNAPADCSCPWRVRRRNNQQLRERHNYPRQLHRCAERLANILIGDSSNHAWVSVAVEPQQPFHTWTVSQSYSH